MSDFKKGDQFEIDYNFVKGSDNLSGKIDLGWYTGETVFVEIVAILKSPNYSGSVFKNLTTKAERIAAELGLSEVIIEFKMVKNPRLASDASWASEFGYYFHATSNKFGTTVTWSKEIK